MDLELLLAAAVLSGFFGSGHCLGMCGPVVILLEKQPTDRNRKRAVIHRLAYNVGRLTFYVLLGAVAGAGGAVLTKIAGANTALMILRVLASLLVIALGLNLLFNIRMLSVLERGGAVIWARLSPLAKHVLPITTPARAFGAGLIWGALPCGLVYGIVAVAAASGNSFNGSLIMLAFWIGTLPALLAAGASARKLASLSNRLVFRRLAGVSLVLVGVFALVMPYLHSTDASHAHKHATTAAESQPVSYYRS